MKDEIIKKQDIAMRTVTLELVKKYQNVRYSYEYSADPEINQIPALRQRFIELLQNEIVDHPKDVLYMIYIDDLFTTWLNRDYTKLQNLYGTFDKTHTFGPSIAGLTYEYQHCRLFINFFGTQITIIG